MLTEGSKWMKYEYVCSYCDSLVTYTTRDVRDGWDPCPICPEKLSLMSVVDVTIENKTEMEQVVETVTLDTYNPHAFITLRKINNDSGDSTYTMYKTTELETVLEDSKQRIRGLEGRLAHQEKQIGQILENLTASGWYSESTDKEDVLSELCTILGHEPKTTLTFSATVMIEGTVEVPLEEVNSFDILYHLQDNLTVDTYHGDTLINSFHVEDVDNQEWE